MAAPAKRIEISAEDRAALERIVRSRKAERRMVERARIVLEAGEGRSAAEIARRAGCSLATAKKWRARYERAGLAGLSDAPRPGRPLVHGPEVRAKLVALACTRPPETPTGLRGERRTHRELDELRALERRPRAVVSLEDAPPLEVVDAPFERVETMEAIWRAVEHLTVDLKLALLLRDVVGLSYTEIADSLEITLATVKWRIYKAREEVQLALAREGITYGSGERAEPAQSR